MFIHKPLQMQICSESHTGATQNEQSWYYTWQSQLWGHFFIRVMDDTTERCQGITLWNQMVSNQEANATKETEQCTSKTLQDGLVGRWCKPGGQDVSGHWYARSDWWDRDSSEIKIIRTASVVRYSKWNNAYPAIPTMSQSLHGTSDWFQMKVDVWLMMLATV